MSAAAVQPETLITPDDLLVMPDGDRYELVDGQLVERTMGMQSSFVGGRLNRILGNICEERALGWVFDADAGYQCFPGRPNLVRRPDVTFIAAGRLPADQLPTGYSRIAPDLAAEVVSPDDEMDEVLRKVNEYLAAGVRLVWVLAPVAHMILVIRYEGGGTILRAGDFLDGENVVPGFRCSVDDLFRPPPGTEPQT